jgi:hypothetical protein
MTNEETMPEPIEIEKSSNVKIPIVDKGINTTQSTLQLKRMQIQLM